MGNLVNQTRLDYYTTKLWERIKTQLTDRAFVSARLVPNSTIMEFTRNDNQVVNVDLANIAGINLPIDATQVNYNNQQSNLPAQDVQTAIDEIVKLLNGGYNTSNYNQQTGELTLTRPDGTFNTYVVEDPNTYIGATLIQNTNTIRFNKVNGTTEDVNLTTLFTASNITFVPGATGMQSQNVQGAIKELNDKFGNYVPIADTTTDGGVPGANMVVRLDGNGLLNENMLPEVATNEYYEVQDLATAENQRNNYQNGDIIYAQDTQKTYLVINNEPNNNFQQDAIIELSPQAGNIGVTDVTYDEATRTLKKEINGREEDVVSGLVRKWEDLDYVEKYSAVNLVDYSKRRNGVKFNSNGQSIENHSDYGLVSFNVNGNQEYTLLRHRANHLRVRLDDVSGNLVQFIDIPTSVRNGWNRAKFTTPQNASVATLELYTKQDNEKDVMILKGDQLDLSLSSNKPIPFADGQLIQVGSEISLGFDNSNSDLKSTTIESAIKEVNEKTKEINLPLTNCEVINLFNDKQMVLGRRYDNAGDIVADRYFATYTHPCNPGDTFTIAKHNQDDDRCVYLTADNQKVLAEAIPMYTRNEIKHYRVTVPANAGIAKIGFNIKTTLNSTQVMIFEGHKDLPAGTQFTPYLSEQILNGNSIITHFDNTNTNLSSTNTRNALEELSFSKADKYITTFNRHKNYRDFSAKYYRIPSLVSTNEGSLLSFADIRYNDAGDQTFIDIGVSRSIDDGKLWNNSIAMINDRAHDTQSRVMDTTSVVTSSGKIIVLAGGWSEGTTNWTRPTTTPTPEWNPYIVTSDTDGLTWSEKISLKEGSPNACANQPQNTVAWLGGVGTGIVKKKGVHKDRIILPIQICVNNGGATNEVKAGCIFSDDDGATWTMSTGFTSSGVSENMIAEIANGDLIMIARRDNQRSKGAYVSTDGGVTWNDYAPLMGKFVNNIPSCQGSWITLELNGQTIGLLSHPKNSGGTYQRDNITIYMYNFDNPNQGVVELYNIYPHLGNVRGAGYSSLCYYKNINNAYKLAVAFETNGNIEFRDISEVLRLIEKEQGITKITELSTRKVDKYTPNVVADLTVENLKIANKPIKVSTPTVGIIRAGSRTLTGSKGTSVLPGTKVTTIQIGLHGFLAGERVTGIEVYAVNKTTDTIIERIIYEGTGVARIPKGYEAAGILYVDVEVNKSYQEEVYFITRIKHNGEKGMRLSGLYPGVGIAFDKSSDDEELAPGYKITPASTRTPNLLVYGDGESIVLTVNKQTPQDGNVTVESQHVPYNDAQTQLNADNVQDAIQKLNDKIANAGGGAGTVTSVNNVQPQPGGDVVLKAIVTQIANQDILLQVGNQDFATLECMTDQDANDIINGFTL